MTGPGEPNEENGGWPGPSDLDLYCLRTTVPRKATCRHGNYHRPPDASKALAQESGLRSCRNLLHGLPCCPPSRGSSGAWFSYLGGRCDWIQLGLDRHRHLDPLRGHDLCSVGRGRCWRSIFSGFVEPTLFEQKATRPGLASPFGRADAIDGGSPCGFRSRTRSTQRRLQAMSSQLRDGRSIPFRLHIWKSSWRMNCSSPRRAFMAEHGQLLVLDPGPLRSDRRTGHRSTDEACARTGLHHRWFLDHGLRGHCLAGFAFGHGYIWPFSSSPLHRTAVPCLAQSLACQGKPTGRLRSGLR